MIPDDRWSNCYLKHLLPNRTTRYFFEKRMIFLDRRPNCLSKDCLCVWVLAAGCWKILILWKTIDAISEKIAYKGLMAQLEYCETRFSILLSMAIRRRIAYHSIWVTPFLRSSIQFECDSLFSINDWCKEIWIVIRTHQAGTEYVAWS